MGKFDFADEDESEANVDEEPIRFTPLRLSLPTLPVLKPGADGVMVRILSSQGSLYASLVP